MEKTVYLSSSALEAGLGTILQSPKDHGSLEYIVRRPRVDEREIVSAATLDPQEGLMGDTWISRGNGTQNPDAQLTLMNARVIALVAGTKDRWALAGDQLFVDLDLSAANLPAGSRLAVGTAIIEISALPHTGCETLKPASGRMPWCLSMVLRIGTCVCAGSTHASSSRERSRREIRSGKYNRLIPGMAQKTMARAGTGPPR